MNGLRFRSDTELRDSCDGRRPIWPPLFSLVSRLDAVVVRTPVDDGLLDSLRLHVFGEGLVGEFGEFGVGGEAKGDELGDGELVDVDAIGRGE